jgi:hypothetical protein
LNIRQGLNAKQQIDLSQIRASILEDVFSRQPARDTVKPQRPSPLAADSNILAELQILYPAVRSLGTSQMIISYSKKAQRDTQRVVLVKFSSALRTADRNKLEQWLRVRYRSAQLRLVAQ